jgi:hypothetical protein
MYNATPLSHKHLWLKLFRTRTENHHNRSKGFKPPSKENVLPRKDNFLDQTTIADIAGFVSAKKLHKWGLSKDSKQLSKKF